MSETPNKIYLSENELPKAWYNLRADMKTQHAPLRNPATLEPITDPAQLSPIFCEELAKQELNTTDRFIELPEEIYEYYKLYRPSPLIRAYNLEKELGTPAKIFYKFEGNNTSGSHKLNSAAAQVYYAKAQGVKGLTTETGAGQWGTALSMACAYFKMPLTVYMVKCSSEQKPFRKAVIETYGASLYPSPSTTTEIGKKMLADDPNTTGSLGMAISEAIEKAVTGDNMRYVLGSVLDQVLLHQSVIGLETKIALDKYDIKPDVLIGCTGGGSNLGGFIAPFAGEKIQKGTNYKIIAVEPASCPSLTRGKFAYDFCDTGKITPLAKMYTLGSGFVPSSIHAGGLRYHGMSPIISQLYHDGIIDEARSVTQTKVFEAATLFAKVETILPAPESSHAIRAAIDEALECKKTGEAKTIVFNLSGTGYFDLNAYSEFRKGNMVDYIPSDEELQKGFNSLPDVGSLNQ
ncbi:MAG TPA: TrpB-like pyridoxal phosphate-dependent enzyme [Oscillospiraceae bacterium]|nr:TrpB-like pyridoxal phosphate-dependent enzyme [Oscillospiraceae bacterium]HPF55467.1 TrpB-like pyridoxal phosphate-dependent enzyme [Clostridiales bacterium]HPK34301.1 TrpB-like pyridoxal phosphate-dependent enzyme [Oscillospiraceae bacterium]